MFGMSSMSANVIILDDENFDDWYNQLKDILGINGLIDLLFEPIIKNESNNDKKTNEDETNVKVPESSTTINRRDILISMSPEDKVKLYKGRLLMKMTVSYDDKRYVDQCMN